MNQIKIIIILTSFFALGGGLLPAGAAEKAPAPPAVWSARSAVKFALANSPEVKIATERINRARAALTRADAGSYPQLSLGAQYSQTNNPMYSFGNILNQGAFDSTIDFNDPGRTDDFALTADLLQRFYSGGGVAAGVAAARAREEAAHGELAALHANLAFEVVRAFYTIVQSAEIVQANQSAIEVIEASLAVATARFEAGSLLKVDLLDLELQKSVAGENLIKATHDHNLAKKGFIYLLGLDTQTIEINSACEEVPLPASLGYEQRPELKVLDALLAAARAGERQAQSARLPVVDGFARYQLDKGFETEGDGASWLAGVKLSYSLFDGSQTAAAITEAAAVVSETVAQRRKSALAITLEVEKAKLGRQQAEERLLVTDKMVAQALERARLSRERFKEGLILTSDLIDVENRLTEARVRHTVARAARRIAVADLRRAVGVPQF